MHIFLNKFGSTLISRQAGKAAFVAFLPILKTIAASEKLEIDFNGVITFSPSWGDEFLTPLQKQFGENLTLLNINDNPSVTESLKIIEQTGGVPFRVV